MQRKNTGFGERRNKIQVTRRRKKKRRRGRWRGREKKGRGRKKGVMEFVWRLARRILAGLRDDCLSNLQKRG